MKRFLIILMLSVLCSLRAGAQWFQVTVPPEFSNAFFLGVSFVDENTGMVCGDSGKVLKTTNGGLNWTRLNTPNWWIWDIQMINFDTVYCVPYFLKTANGGLNWTFINNAQCLASVYNISFINSKTGYVSGGIGGGLLKTSNAGENWIVPYCGWPPYDEFNDVYAVNELVAYAGAKDDNYTKLLRSTNGGYNWGFNFAGSGNILGMHFLTDSSGIWVTNDGYIERTTNAGLSSWLTVAPQGLTDVQFTSDTMIVVAVGNNGSIFRSPNSGFNWEQQYTPVTNTELK